MCAFLGYLVIESFHKGKIWSGKLSRISPVFRSHLIYGRLVLCMFRNGRRLSDLRNRTRLSHVHGRGRIFCFNSQNISVTLSEVLVELACCFFDTLATIKTGSYHKHYLETFLFVPWLSLYENLASDIFNKLKTAARFNLYIMKNLEKKSRE